jgi:hypothetical protein
MIALVWIISIIVASVVAVAVFVFVSIKRRWAHRVVLPCCAIVDAIDGVEFNPDHVEDAIRSLACCLYVNGQLTREQVIDHMSQVEIRLHKPRKGDSAAVPFFGGTWKEGTCSSPFIVDVTWRPPPKPCALKYELINALLWRYKGEAAAYAEGHESRKDFDSCQ